MQKTQNKKIKNTPTLVDKKLFPLLAQKNNLSPQQVENIITQFFEILKNELAQGKRVVLTNFFALVIDKIYKKPNPVTHYRSKKIITYYAKGFRWYIKSKIARQFKKILDQAYQQKQENR
jgi:nucleoid DNA-binding protein